MFLFFKGKFAEMNEMYGNESLEFGALSCPYKSLVTCLYLSIVIC